MIKLKHLAAMGLLFLMLPLTALADLRSFAMEEALKMPMPLTDISLSHPNYRAIAVAIDDEIIKGYPDNTFKPDNIVNRAELMKMVAIAYVQFTPGAILSIVDGRTLEPVPMTVFDDPKYQNCFKDVTTEWFAPYICFAKEKGWVEGYADGTFKPAQNVNRVEAQKMILNALLLEEEWPTPTDAERALPMPSDADMNQWYAPYLRFSIVKELLDGQHVTQNDDQSYYYKPADGMTRKEVAEMIFRTELYSLERPTYAEVYATMTCFQKENSNLSEDEAYQAWLTHLDALNTDPDPGKLTFTQEEIDALYLKYAYDDVVNQAVKVYEQDFCEGVE